MGWSGQLTASSAEGTSITFTPSSAAEGAYSASSFTAPKTGVYKFTLKGSGGTVGGAAGTLGGTVFTAPGGVGGSTEGYLLLRAGETVHVGAGGTCCAAFVSDRAAGRITDIAQADAKASFFFIAGAGGAGGAIADNVNNTGWNCLTMRGGVGGGTSGGTSGTAILNGTSETGFIGGRGGSQSAGGVAGGNYSTVKGTAGAYGTGGAGAYAKQGGYAAQSGRGGDGYFGGGAGHAHAYISDDAGTGGAHGYAGGGGSGYVRIASLTVIGKTYASTTRQQGGGASGEAGSVTVEYHARGLLPVFFDGTQLERLFINNTEVTSLVYNGTTIYMRRWSRCLRSMAERFGFRRGIRAGSYSRAMQTSA